MLRGDDVELVNPADATEDTDSLIHTSVEDETKDRYVATAQSSILHSTCGLISVCLNALLMGLIIGQLYDPWNLLVPFFHVSSATDTSIHFFNADYSRRIWDQKQQYLNNLFGNGKWIDAWSVPGYRIPYTDPCIQITHYKNGKCMDSLPSQGRRMFWKPDDGFINSFSAETMCGMMNGRNILVVGDSLNEEFFFTLLSTMWAQIIRPKKSTQNELFWESMRSDLDNKCQDFCLDPMPSCTGPGTIYCGEHPSFTIGFERDDYLTHQQNASRTNYTLVETWWVKQIRAENISLLVLNTGAHYRPIDMELATLRDSLKYIYANFPEISVMYRTTIAGHENCESTFHSEPLAEPPVSYTQHPEYHWGDIALRNLDVQSMLSLEFPQVLQFDVFNATSIRADSHPGSGNDCLHYCMPGVVDDWVLFFYNALLKVTDSSHLTREEGTHLEIPTRQSMRTDLEGKNIRNRVADTIYYVRDGSKHVYINRTGIDLNDATTVNDEDFFHIPSGKPMD